MAELRHTEVGGGLYGRLLQRLAIALEEADAVARLQQTVPAELELRGLTPAELELIRAYLDGDLHWLQGWHAAAEELARLERHSAGGNRGGGKRPVRPAGALLARGKPPSRKHQALCCALCGFTARLLRDEGVLPCQVCGSRLFRTGQVRQ